MKQTERKKRRDLVSNMPLSYIDQFRSRGGCSVHRCIEGSLPVQES